MHIHKILLDSKSATIGEWTCYYRQSMEMTSILNIHNRVSKIARYIQGLEGVSRDPWIDRNLARESGQ